MPKFIVTVDDFSPMINYSNPATWTVATGDDPDIASYYKNSSHSTTSRSEASFTFKGTGMTLYGSFDVNHGPYSVQVDDQTAHSGNGYSANKAYRQPLYSNMQLDYGDHTVTASNQNTGSDMAFAVDYVDLEFGDGDGSTKEQLVTLEDSPDGTNVTYNDLSWKQRKASGYSASSSRYTITQNATMTVDFWGKAITIFGCVNKDHGQYSVSLDGAQPMMLTGFRPLFRCQQVLYYANNLDSRQHSVIIRNEEAKYFDLDFVNIYTWNSSPSSSGHKSLSHGAITGIALGAFTCTALVTAGVLFFLLFLRQRRARADVRKSSTAKSRSSFGSLEPFILGRPASVEGVVRPSTAQNSNTYLTAVPFTSSSPCLNTPKSHHQMSRQTPDNHSSSSSLLSTSSAPVRPTIRTTGLPVAPLPPVYFSAGPETQYQTTVLDGAEGARTEVMSSMISSPGPVPTTTLMNVAGGYDKARLH